jgi:plasmid stability protein
MATLTIRNISDAALARFRVIAAEHGRSMEAEARALIEHASAGGEARLAPAERVAKAQALFREAFNGNPPQGLVDELIADRRAAAARGE